MKKLILLLCLLVTLHAFSAISVSVTMSGTTIASFTSFAAAIAAVNSLTITGPVEILLPAGQIDTSTGKIILNATGTSSNPIIIRKDGIGANPKVCSYTGSLPASGGPNITHDGIFTLVGSDHVTIDGIDFTDITTATTGTAAMEYGIGLVKSSTTNGCQYVTIKNCNITLRRVQTSQWTYISPWLTTFSGSTGIAMINTANSSYTYLTPGSINGTHSYNTFENNTIDQCNTGILILGYESSDSTLSDRNNTVSENTITNFGGYGTSVADASGIYAHGQNNLFCGYNTITNNNGSGNNHKGHIYSIIVRNCGKQLMCRNNSMSITMGAVNGAYGAWGVYCSQSTASVAPGSTIAIAANELSISYPDCSTGGINGFIVHPGTGTEMVRIDSNIINPMQYCNNTVKGQGGIFGIYSVPVTAGVLPTIYVRNNWIKGITRYDTSGFLGTYPIWISSGNAKYISGNIVENISSYGIGSNNDITGITVASTTNTLYCDSNIVSRIMMYKTSYSNTLAGIRTLSSASPTIEHYRGNTIDSIYNNGSTASLGIYLELGTTTGSSRSISNNKISNIKGATESIGILTGRPIGTIEKNNIYNLYNTSSTGYLSGVKVSPGGIFTTTISNNFISGLYPHTASNVSSAVTGINMSVGTPVDMFHNTIVIDSVGNNLSSTGTNFGGEGISLVMSNTYTKRIMNNIINIKGIPRGTSSFTAIRGTGTATTKSTPVGLQISNNVLYANPRPWNFLFVQGFTNIASNSFCYKNGFGIDSITTDTVRNVQTDAQFNTACGLFNRFIGGTNLTENNTISGTTPGTYYPSGASYAKSRVTNNLGITTDYHGTTRPNPTDIGALEFIGTAISKPAVQLSLATVTTITTAQCVDDSGWTYYGKAHNPELIFAMNKSGTTGITGDTVTITVDTNQWSLMSLGANRPTGSFLLKHGWNVTTTNTSFTGIARVRFPYNTSDTLYTQSLRDTAYNRALATNPSIISVKNLKLEWFKTINVPYNAVWRAGILGNLFPNNHIKLQPVYNSSGGVGYVQFDSITSFSGGSGGYSFGPPNGTGSNGLAVTWLNISGVPTDTGNLISWSTASEENSKYFSPEYSFDAITFYPTGDTIVAAGKSTSQRTYSLLHKYFDSLMYYRIIQVGNDNEHDKSVSKTCVIKRQKNVLPQVSVYPNPFSDNIHVISNYSGNMVIYDVLGQQVFIAPVSLGDETHDLSHLRTGLYIVEISTSTGNQVIKIEKR